MPKHYLDEIGELRVTDETGEVHVVKIRREDLTSTNAGYRALRDTIDDTLKLVLAINRSDQVTDRDEGQTMSRRAAYYKPDRLGHKRCRPGNVVKPSACDYHQEHHWCATCEGYYGVEHDHGPFAYHDSRECVCKPCLVEQAHIESLRGTAQ